MNNYEIMQFTYTFAFNKTRKPTLKKNLFDCIKNSLKDIAELKDAEVDIKAKTIRVKCKDFALMFNSSNYLYMSSVFNKEETADLINLIFNKVLSKLLEKNLKTDLGVTVISSFSAKISKEIDLFQYLINQDTMKRLFDNDRSFSPKRIEIWQPPGDMLRKGFYLKREKYATILDCIRSDFYKNIIPQDTGIMFMSELKKQADEFLTKLTGEICR